MTTKNFKWLPGEIENKQEAEEEKKENKPVKSVQQQQLNEPLLNHLDASLATSILPKKVDVPCKRVIEPIVFDRRFDWFNIPFDKIFKYTERSSPSVNIILKKDYIRAFAEKIDSNTAKYIQRHSKDTCRFLFGKNGAQQIEFDYSTLGNQFDNSFAFWLRAFNKAGEVPQAEVDMLEKIR